MLYVHTPSQKLNTIRISVLRNVTKIFKKSTIVKKSKTYIGKNVVYGSSAFAGALWKKINPKYEQIRNTNKLVKYEHIQNTRRFHLLHFQGGI